MKWEKLGLVYCPDQKTSPPWKSTHASTPFVEPLGGDLFKVYFSSRDLKNRSSIASVTAEFKDQFKIIEEPTTPVLSYGESGFFDDSGVSLGCVTEVGGQKFLYYVGWNLSVTVPWRNSIGLAVFDEKTKSFKKFSRAPIMDRSEVDPFSLSYPFVLKEGDKYRMWYGSNLSWSGNNKDDMKHVIKFAESKDGIQWVRDGLIAIPLSSDKEVGVSRPYVIFEKGQYKMWFSYRGSKYRVGFAVSSDGKNWEREDSASGFEVSQSGWDSESVEYPCFFDHKGSRYALYNGNGYGKTGFGLARLVS